MTRSNRRRIVRVGQIEEVEMHKEQGNNTLTDDIDLVFKVLLFAGLVFPPLNSKKQKSNWYANVFEAVYHIFAVIIIIVNLLFWQRRYSSATLHFSTSLTIFLAIAVRFSLCISRKQIPQMARSLIHLHDDVTWRRPHKSMKTTILLSCFMPALLTTISTVLDIYHLQAMRAKEEHSIQFNIIKLDSINASHQIWMYYMFLFLGPIKMYFAYGVSVIIFIFCCAVYTIAKRIVLALNEQIRSHDNYGLAITSRTISVYLDFYNRLNKIVADIDEVLSPCVLLLYGLMVSGQFYTLTVLISKDTEPSSLTTAFQNVIVFLLTTVAFLVVTLTASKVNEVAEDVKRSLNKLANGATDSERLMINDRDVANSYLILISILNGSQLSFTGWRMFNINRSFILTTMGVMISYGVIIVQIGRKSANLGCGEE